MDYQKIYNALILKRKINKLDKKFLCCKLHHIIPKSLGGINSSSNLVNLTPREHYIAHRLLEKIAYNEYGINDKRYLALSQALWFMMHDKKYPDIRLTSKSYNEIRIRYSLSISGINNRNFGKYGKLSKSYGHKHTLQSNEANKTSHLGRKHMHNPITDKAICVKAEEVDMYLKLGYVIGMSLHERQAISNRNKSVKHMYNPVTDQQVYALPKDIKKYLDNGFIFGRNLKSRKKHNDILRNRTAFYDKDTHKKFMVNCNEFSNMVKLGHIPSKAAIRKMKN